MSSKSGARRFHSPRGERPSEIPVGAARDWFPAPIFSAVRPVPYGTVERRVWFAVEHRCCRLSTWAATALQDADSLARDLHRLGVATPRLFRKEKASNAR